MNRIIALLTDFGTADYFVGAMKGAILSINPAANVVDITHDIAPQNIASAGFTLRACYKNFPAQTVFVAVVDPGVGSSRRAILVKTEDYCFVAPDNGLLSFVFDEASDARVIELTSEKFFSKNVSRTFHGRDIFAPVAAHLSNGVQAREFGAEIQDCVRLETSAPRAVSANRIEGSVIHIDRFGNLITNLTAEDLPEKFLLEVGARRQILKRREFYAEAKAGELFVITGSAGFLEIVAFQASAKEILRAQIGLKVEAVFVK